MVDKLIRIIADDAKKIINKNDFSELSEKTIVITGASGLIGTYFLECLKQIKEDLRLVAVIQSEPVHYLEHILDDKRIRILRGDLTSHSFLNEIPQAEYIIHTAGYAQPGRFMEDQIKTLKLNTEVQLSLFEKLSTDGKYLFVSSSEVYSGSPNVPYKETDIGITNTTHPRSCYIEGKRCGEAVCNAYRAKGVDAKSARLSLAYGPGTKRGDKRVMNSFIQKALEGKITLLDQGRAKRTYCYVSDAVEIMWKILLHGKEAIYNVGGNSRITIRELAQKIGSCMKVPVEFPKEAHEAEGAPEDVYLDMTKVINEFGKTEYVPFDEGLARTIEWQKALYSSKEGI
jgi:nucleoside-diphosphate-sugar epimerase